MDIKIINPSLLNEIKLDNKTINIIDINYNQNLNFQKISNKSNDYIKECFKMSFKILKSGITNKLINGPISKNSFLNKKFLGITEYLAKKTKTDQSVMLIYNKRLSVSPITTHLPLKFVAKNINKKKIIEKITLIDNFYKKKFNFLKKIIKLIPIRFIQDPLFIDKVVVTSIMEEYFSKKNTITSFTSNMDVILNISPAINSDKKTVEKKIDELEDILKNGLEKLVLKFVQKNLI